MAFTYTVTDTVKCGAYKQAYGTWTTDTTTGTIYTGLSTIFGFTMRVNDSSVVADDPTVDETFPLNTDGVTVIVTSDADGYWSAIGK